MLVNIFKQKNSQQVFNSTHNTLTIQSKYDYIIINQNSKEYLLIIVIHMYIVILFIPFPYKNTSDRQC